MFLLETKPEFPEILQKLNFYFSEYIKQIMIFFNTELSTDLYLLRSPESDLTILAMSV